MRVGSALPGAAFAARTGLRIDARIAPLASGGAMIERLTGSYAPHRPLDAQPPKSVAQRRDRTAPGSGGAGAQNFITRLALKLRSVWRRLAATAAKSALSATSVRLAASGTSRLAADSRSDSPGPKTSSA